MLKLYTRWKRHLKQLLEAIKSIELWRILKPYSEDECVNNSSAVSTAEACRASELEVCIAFLAPKDQG